jgi:hypothetical protein
VEQALVHARPAVAGAEGIGYQILHGQALLALATLLLDSDLDGSAAHAGRALELYRETGNRLGIDAWWLDASEPDIHSNIDIAEHKRRIGPTALGPGARIRDIRSAPRAGHFLALAAKSIKACGPAARPRSNASARQGGTGSRRSSSARERFASLPSRTRTAS